LPYLARFRVAARTQTTSPFRVDTNYRIEPMKRWIDRILLVAVTLLVAVLAASTLPWIVGGHFSGKWLLVHMTASGALVITLPLLALSYLWRNISRENSGLLQFLGYWLLIASGLTTIATIFLCMLPLPSTEQMHNLVAIHTYAGFAMVPASLLLLFGVSRWRRIQSTRSATPG